MDREEEGVGQWREGGIRREVEKGEEGYGGRRR